MEIAAVLPIAGQIFPRHFDVCWEFFEVFLQFLFTCFTIYRGIHEDVLRNHGGKRCCDIGVFVNLTKKGQVRT